MSVLCCPVFVFLIFVSISISSKQWLMSKYMILWKYNLFKEVVAKVQYCNLELLLLETRKELYE